MYEYRMQFSKEVQMKFLSHLELVKTFERALRRAQLAIAYSEGFHPHPKISFGPALAVGLSSIDEYMDVVLLDNREPEAIQNALNPVLPKGLKITAVRRCHGHLKPLNAIINRASYMIELETSSEMTECVAEGFEQLLEKEEIWLTRTNKNGSKTVNIRPWMHNLKTEKVNATHLHVYVTGEIGSGGNLRPEELIKLVTHPAEVINIVRVGLWHEQDGIAKKPLDFC